MLKIWRIIYFPFIAILSTVIALPIIILRPFHARNNSVFQKIFNFLAFPFFGIDFKIFDQHYFEERPAIVIGNHQHNFDLLMCSKGLLPGMITVGKREIVFIPFFGLAFWLAGNILLNRQNSKSALTTLNKLEKKIFKDNLSVVIFPEGHRNDKRELLPFKKGAFYTAIHCQIPIICFSVSSYARNLKLGEKHSCSIHVKVHPPISTKGMTEKDIPMLIEKTKKIILDGRDQLDKDLNY